jgi:small subunit ribosomal protein S12
MPTIKQLINGCRVRKQYKIKKFDLQNNPQRLGTCMKLLQLPPKKPNSARRRCARVALLARFWHRSIWCYIPGEGHDLRKFSTVLVRGGRVKDLPGVKYKLIRGKYDLKPVYKRRKARSKYGLKRFV